MGVGADLAGGMGSFGPGKWFLLLRVGPPKWVRLVIRIEGLLRRFEFLDGAVDWAALARLAASCCWDTGLVVRGMRSFRFEL